MRHAVIVEGKVINVIIAPLGFELPGKLMIPVPPGVRVEPGWEYTAGNFAAPLVEPPKEPGALRQLAESLKAAPQNADELAALDEIQALLIKRNPPVQPPSGGGGQAQSPNGK